MDMEKQNNLRQFFEKLKDFELEFKEKELESIENIEISNIVKAEDEREIQKLFKCIVNILDKPYLEFYHPEKDNLKTRGVYSVKLGMVNFVLFVDENFENPWLFAQCTNFVDVIITKFSHYRIMPPMYTIVLGKLLELSENLSSNISKIKYDTPFAGFLLNHPRPYHHFYDHLKYAYLFKKDKRLSHISYKTDDASFFIPNTWKEETAKVGVFIYPALIANNFLNPRVNDFVKNLNEEMEKNVSKEVQEYCNLGSEGLNKYDLTLWLGITGQKRSWMEQVDGYINIIKYLLKDFKKINIYIDGMTANEGKKIRNNDDQKIFNEIKKELSEYSQCTLVSLIGEDYRTKINTCAKVDLFIANAGTGCMVPLRFCKKPGVLHSNTKLFTFRDNYPSTVKKNNKKYTIDIVDEDMQRIDFTSYHIPWQHIFNLTVDVLKAIKGTNIKYLDIPKSKEEKNKIFKRLSQKIKPEDKSADILRKIAFVFEESGDIKTACSLMQKAHELKPNGPGIIKKLKEYKASLNS